MTASSQPASSPKVLLYEPDPAAEVPLIYDSPHSGRYYPDDFEPSVSVELLHGYEDRLVDDLVADAPQHGIALIAAAFPRAYIDPNRAADDIDADLIGEDWTDPLNPTLYSQRGHGLVFRKSLEGKPIYERPLGKERLRSRIEGYWRPYHQALEQALQTIQQRCGDVWHISWHSMRPVGDESSSDPGEERPDFVVSDLDGDSAGVEFTRHAIDQLRELGYSVNRNWPFKGGYITQLHGRPHEGRHSIQIEINRGLYLDLATLELTPGAEHLRSDLAEFSSRIAAFASSRSAIPS
jgi:N-formylglutamate deformylase